MTNDVTAIREQYDELVLFKKRVRDEVREEIERRAAERVQEETVKLSVALREAYKNGATKTELRKAVRAYTNATSWNALWNAAADVAPVEERRTSEATGRSKPAPTQSPFSIVTEDPKDQGAKYIEAGKKAVLRVQTGPDGVPYDEPIDIPLERYSLRGPWRPDPGAEWYEEDDHGNLTVHEEYMPLLAWGSSKEAAIRRIEQEYQAKGK